MEEGYIHDQIFKGRSAEDLAAEMSDLFINEGLDVSMEVLWRLARKILQDNRNFRQPKDIEELNAKMWEENPDF